MLIYAVLSLVIILYFQCLPDPNECYKGSFTGAKGSYPGPNPNEIQSGPPFLFEGKNTDVFVLRGLSSTSKDAFAPSPGDLAC
jgi:hypothetical protein